jgi:hypothetical protein
MSGQIRFGSMRAATVLLIAVLAACVGPSGVGTPKPESAIDADLRAHADRWEILERKVGAGKIHDFQFGDYTIVSGEIGAHSGKATRTHLALETRRRAVTSYSFVLKGAGASTANVQATQTAKVTWHTLLEFFPGFYVGPAGGGVEYSSDSEEDEEEACWEDNDACWDDDEGHKRVKSSIDEQLVATIVVEGVASAPWELSLDANRSGVLFELVVRSASLTVGSQTIAITPLTAFERADGRPMWAYQFVDRGTTLAAVEFGDGVGSVAWMRRELPEDTRLMLAAAMTAILQGQATTPQN